MKLKMEVRLFDAKGRKEGISGVVHSTKMQLYGECMDWLHEVYVNGQIKDSCRDREAVACEVGLDFRRNLMTVQNVVKQVPASVANSDDALGLSVMVSVEMPKVSNLLDFDVVILKL